MKRFHLMEVPTNWEDRPCVGTDLELWFGASDDTPAHLRESAEDMRRRESVAKATCAGCPFVVRCLESELEHGIGGQWGVRGGMTAKERQDLIRTRRQAAVAALVTDVEVA
ncbi:Transcription factor WhiB [Lentzea xinjiangensis]|uniref:Transcription factor WhiB n=1 Tax=Lentzea xinjiangensis TaxID=402600 RepID=A0A1H9WVH0_9PSEU|nr:Transcription factor WhiB [Lentzea xinjiangensis]